MKIAKVVCSARRFLGVQLSSRRALSFDESPKSISSNVQDLSSRTIPFSKEGAKSFYSNAEKITLGKDWAMMAFIAGLLTVAISLYPATKDIIEDASAKSEKIAPKIKDCIVENHVFDFIERDGDFVDRPIQ